MMTLFRAAVFCALAAAAPTRAAATAFDLAKIPDVRIFRGDAMTSYRDPAVHYEDGVFHLFFTYCVKEKDGQGFSYTAQSESRDLVRWTPPRILTPRGRELNFSSPGNVVCDGDERVLCLQTYPTPGTMKYADKTARIFTMRTRDWKTWTAPELLKVKGDDVPVADMGRMIDPYILRDRDDPGLWRCFYKQNGVSFSTSRDLRHWTFAGRASAGENVCVLLDAGRYVMFHSPVNGIGMKTSDDAVNWRDEGELITLGQRDWPWASGRLTAGAVIDCRKVPGIGKYLLFFHASSPKDFSPASLGLAWSDDLRTWSWPGKASGAPRADGWSWIAPAETSAGHPAFEVEKTFACPADMTRAVLRHTSLGVSETFVNGQRVGDVELKPGFTCAGVRQFHADDVTALLKPGAENRLSAEVSDAYWRDLISGDPLRIGGRENGYAAELTVERREGAPVVVRTGTDWRVSCDGPLVSGGIYEGETRDATRTESRTWREAKAIDPPVSVVPAVGDVRIRRDLVRHAAVPFTVRPGERRIVDFGQNGAAREAFTVKGARGARVEIRHAEVLRPDGTCYFDNLRRTAALTAYVLGGEGEETFRPRHTYYGFRYVEIRVSEPVVFTQFDYEPISSVRDETGHLETSDPDLNRVISCAEWSLRSNQLSVPTDCCNRGERLGWMGDALVSAPAACWLWDTREFYLGKVARDQRDMQVSDGRYSSLSPGRGGELDEDKYGIAAWSDAGVLIAHAVSRHFGVQKALSDHWPSMRLYGDWLIERGGPFPGYWGDWLSFQRMGYGEKRYPWGSDRDTHAFLAMAYRCRDFDALAEMATALGHAADAGRYGAAAAAARKALHEKCFTRTGLRPEYACQTTYALALNWDLCPDEAVRRTTVEDLELNVIRSGRRLMTGVLGTPQILGALSENGKASLAYDLLLSRACPSWRYMVDRGATTLWERWDGVFTDGSFNDPAMNSFNHADFACVLDWMYRTMVGIRPDPAKGGFGHIMLCPRPDRRVRCVAASYRAPQGVILAESEFADDGTWTYDVTLPDGVVADVALPDGRTFVNQRGHLRYSF